MTPTKHATDRWAERFEGFSMEREFCRAVLPLSAQELSAVKSKLSNPRNIERTSREFKGVYFRKTAEGICFVVAPGEIVVTAFVVDRGAWSKARLNENLDRVTAEWKQRVERLAILPNHN